MCRQRPCAGLASVWVRVNREARPAVGNDRSPALDGSIAMETTPLVRVERCQRVAGGRVDIDAVGRGHPSVASGGGLGL